MSKPISINKNVFVNYLGQGYSTMVGIVVLPLFLKILGPEAFGLVGFFTLLQGWLRLLDFGMTPTLEREVAKLKNDSQKAVKLKTIVNSIELIFLAMSIIVSSTTYFSRFLIANHWLNFQILSIKTVSTSIAMMGVIIGFRWLSSMSRSGVNAYERQVWMSAIDILFNTLRYPCAFLVIWLGNGGIITYFIYQAILSFFELLVIRGKFQRLLPRECMHARLFSLNELKEIAPFAMGVAYTGAVWVLLTQVDKLVLSKVLPLDEYGYFSLVATLSSGIMLLGAPISKAILPRMTNLLENGKRKDMVLIFRRATRILLAISAPVTIVISIFPVVTICTWTGNTSAAMWSAHILTLYALGSGLLTVVAFQYYLQYAHGIVRYHVFYNTLLSIVSVPSIIFFGIKYGAIGVGWVWLAFRLVSLLLWVPYVYKKILPGLYLRWIFVDVLPAILISLLVVFPFWYWGLFESLHTRTLRFVLLVLITFTGVFFSLMYALQYFQKFKGPAIIRNSINR